MAAILNFGSISKKSLAYPHVARNVMLKFQKKITSIFLVFVPTRKRDAGRQTPDRILARVKFPFPYGRGIQTKSCSYLEALGGVVEQSRNSSVVPTNAPC